MMDFLIKFQSVWTVIVFILFVGIVIWAWSGKNKAAFDEASRIPLEDDEDVVVATKKKENSNG